MPSRVVTGEGGLTQVRLSVSDYKETKRTEWALKWPGQIILACDQVYWSLETEEAIEEGKLQEYHDKCHQQLLDVTQLVRMDLTKLQRVSLGAMVTLDVHGRDVIQNLVKAGIKHKGDFEWSAQLRYYWLESDRSYSGSHNAYLAQIENSFRYGCEYLGNTMRLVVTPLTDRIYLTLTGALGMALGGAPAGPAGTGKTETTKDLAKAMAKQCIVFNCQEGMDYIMVGTFFKGLSMSGAWACFDEFNRINIEVLSVIAQQLLTINQAIVNKLEVASCRSVPSLFSAFDVMLSFDLHANNQHARGKTLALTATWYASGSRSSSCSQSRSDDIFPRCTILSISVFHRSVLCSRAPRSP
jgi:dynein heavy chain